MRYINEDGEKHKTQMKEREKGGEENSRDEMKYRTI